MRESDRLDASRKRPRKPNLAVTPSTRHNNRNCAHSHNPEKKLPPMSCQFQRIDGGYWSNPRNPKDYCDHCRKLTANYCEMHGNTVCDDCEHKHENAMEPRKQKRQTIPR